MKKVEVIKKPKTSQEAFKKNAWRDVFGFLITFYFKITFENLTNNFFCARNFEYTLGQKKITQRFGTKKAPNFL